MHADEDEERGSAAMDLATKILEVYTGKEWEGITVMYIIIIIITTMIYVSVILEGMLDNGGVKAMMLMIITA